MTATCAQCGGPARPEDAVRSPQGAIVKYLCHECTAKAILAILHSIDQIDGGTAKA